MAKDSSSLTLANMQRISDAVGIELSDPAVAGIVVLHGTDAMEESSLLVHLQHALPKPVVFTGAQFTADHRQADGPANLARAIETALDQRNAEKGVLLSFGGRCLPAWGLYKLSADAADAFRSARPQVRPQRRNLLLPSRTSGLISSPFIPVVTRPISMPALQRVQRYRACCTRFRQCQPSHR